MIATFSAFATAQCPTQWLRGFGSLGVNGGVAAVASWDRDGAGPATPVLAVAGFFTVAGRSDIRGVAAYDPATRQWSALGTGVRDYVAALAPMPNGDLVVGGSFTFGSSGVGNGVARWDGSSWVQLGAGVIGQVRALLTMPNGDLIVAGEFSMAGTVSAANIARWDGTSWFPLGAGLTNSPAGTYAAGARSLALLPNGDLIVGGSFLDAGGVSARNLARWDGSAWFSVGTGLIGPTSIPTHVAAVATTATGDIVVAGRFGAAGGVPANNVARWNGTSWSPMGGGLDPLNEETDMEVLPNGDVVIAGGVRLPSGTFLDWLARWDGTSWSTLAGGANADARALALLPNGVLAVAGGFSIVGRTVAAGAIALWDGMRWDPLAEPGLEVGPNAPVLTLLELANGDLIAGGVFDTAGGEVTGPVARLRNGSWSSLGFGGSLVSVRALAEMPNGDLVVAGVFSLAGGVAANNIARWNGTTWAPLGQGLLTPNGTEVNALIVLPNGDLVAGGSFTLAGGAAANRIARWDGASWLPLGAGVNGTVYALAIAPSGDLLAGGAFTVAGGAYASHIARWNGASWSDFGDSGVFGQDEYVSALAVLPDGDVVAGGSFSAAGLWNPLPVNNLARWDGTGWDGLAGGVPSTGAYMRAVDRLVSLPNGDLLVAGGFQSAGTSPFRFLARFDGAGWSGFGSSTDGPVHGAAMTRSGQIVVGGWFSHAGGQVAMSYARIRSTCPASALPFGSGCSGSGGVNTLVATALPWAGSMFRSLATGMPANALALDVHGLGSQSMPLASLLPQGVAGCALLANPDLLDLLVPVGGSLQTQFAIPSGAALIGQVLYQQVVPIEFDALGNMTAITSTNALKLTIGSY